MGHRRRRVRSAARARVGFDGAACSSAIATTTASRSSIRTASSSTSGISSAVRAAIYIDKNDILYVADSESDVGLAQPRTDWKRGIRIGSAKDGKVTAFIPDPDENATGTSAAEGVVVDAMGNVYGAEVGPRAVEEIREEVKADRSIDDDNTEQRRRTKCEFSSSLRGSRACRGTSGTSRRAGRSFPANNPAARTPRRTRGPRLRAPTNRRYPCCGS